ncbi:MAG: HDOD domain-containing protein [Planctomycetes bacterium]|nr:HDOD domain-containing protein [Planctomycetota bacterium]
MENDRLSQVLEGLRDVEPWPPVATRVLRLSQQPDVVPSELVAVIQTDAGLTARALRLCNSAYYGFQREIATLSEAGNLLGTRALVNLVMTSCAQRYFRPGGGRESERARRLWERSMMNALAANLLASVDGGIDRHLAYTVALLQNIGHVVIDTHLESYRAEIDAARAAGRDMLAAEREVLGIDHAELGARLARRWSLPEVIADTIEHHHRPEEAREDERLCAVVHLAECVTYALALGEGLDGLAYALSDSAMGLVGFDPGRFERMEDALLAELRKARDLVDVA